MYKIHLLGVEKDWGGNWSLWGRKKPQEWKGMKEYYVVCQNECLHGEMYR